VAGGLFATPMMVRSGEQDGESDEFDGFFVDLTGGNLV